MIRRVPRGAHLFKAKGEIMFKIILTYVQPLTVIVFVISGLCCYFLKRWNQGTINFLLGAINLFIFYGEKIFRALS